MDKRLVFPGNTENKRELFFVREDRNYLRKHSSSYHPKVSQYIEKAKPIPGLVQVLLTALGAHEFWGQNVNGDRFPEIPLKHEGPDYGYQTFLTNGNYFIHHVNRDPALAKGKVLHSVWNDKAHRVELIVGISPELDPEATTSIDRGETLCFSMGCKVPYDVCSICGNKAKTRAQYCDHLRYQMNHIDPVTGLLVGAINTLPRFFDISRVLIPADKTAYMWTKVASAANPFHGLSSAQLAELPPGKIADLSYLHKVAEERKEASTKRAAVAKKAEIVKRVESNISPGFEAKLERSIPIAKGLLDEASPTLSPEQMKELRAIAPSLGHLLSTFLALAMQPKPDELASLGSELTPDSLKALQISPDLFDPAIAQRLMPLAPERSFARPLLLRRIIIIANKLDKKDPGITKKAQTIAQLSRQEQRPEHDTIHPGLVAGVLAALYAMFGQHAGPMASGVGRVISNHPFLAMALGVGALEAFRGLTGPVQSGIYSVDDPEQGFYNNNWQSRFAQMQARPVTVIKTGAAKTYDRELAAKVYAGLPAIWVGSKALKVKNQVDESRGKQPGLISRTIANNPEIMMAGLIGEHVSGRPISSRIEKVLKGSKRFAKHASIRDIDFLMSVPDSEKELFWDLAILDAADRIEKKISEL